jgi:hypothetical protein
VPVIQTTWEAEIRRIVVPGQPRQKSLRPCLNVKKAGHGDTHPIPVTVGSIKKENCGLGLPGGKKQDPISKITRAKRARGMYKR